MLQKAHHAVSHAGHVCISATKHRLMALHDKERHAKLFFSDSNYRANEICQIRHGLRDFADELSQEAHESEDMAELLVKYGQHGHHLTKDEKLRVKAQLIDFAKVVPALGIFLLPGGAALLPIIAKILPFDLMPSSFSGAAAKQEALAELRMAMLHYYSSGNEPAIVDFYCHATDEDEAAPAPEPGS